MHLVFANIGSNIGDREFHIRQAIERIADEFGICCESTIIESEPWGFDSKNIFLNVGLSFKTNLTPDETLRSLNKIEREICTESHRDNEGKYADRKIDIDIMAIDQVMLETEMLTLPHACLEKRDFFLIPMTELSPAWTNPRNGKTAKEMLCELYQGSRHGCSAE
ncbi:MAG: 2-amino-4-hydroxy-6-hydroxymethyldihydropteridine diphosphokinase [Muribaculaceae bacterium]|nr:2-amino-4-hydroxy-6-hydroxymethyldihydropteridine diphosphokinase [Muribaculaceae bacterium]